MSFKTNQSQQLTLHDSFINQTPRTRNSLMIALRCRRMSWLEIIYQTTANVVRLLYRLGNDELVTADLRHYLDEDDRNQVIYHCKSEDVSSRLERVLREAEKVKGIMCDEA